MAITQIADILVPSIWTDYTTVQTAEQSALVDSGVLVRDPEIDGLLAGGGKTFDLPHFGDLGDTDPTSSTGTTGSPITVENIGTHKEVGARLSRNKAWGSLDLAKLLAGADPMKVIAERVSPYWARHLQKTVLAVLKGVFADNTANDGGDYTKDISGGSYQAGVTDFSAEAFIDALGTAGDSEEGLGMVFAHSVVVNRMRKNNLIDFVSDSANPAAAKVMTFLGRRVIQWDGMPKAGNVYETFILGQGAIRWGVATHPNPLSSQRDEKDAGGGGSETLHSRVVWCVHPTGHAYIAGSVPDGGPDNTANANMFGAAASWDRRFPERKQIKIARLITREA